jgi:AraC-like DNA-binding protein
MKEALHLLSQQANAGKSVDEIAEAAGFNDRKTFYRVFKKTTGLSPTDFRKNMRK